MILICVEPAAPAPPALLLPPRRTASGMDAKMASYSSPSLLLHGATEEAAAAVALPPALLEVQGHPPTPPGGCGRCGCH
jgi:hypothetical protein